ncbi:PREDICTED: glutathione S-transferase-like [Dinoponera quadriceps]|uniref:glutathione transferase n=1 Tax=Dinoponera quadriceps TaxID=609295 RepID=A0A6P3X0Y2_DINQU|nr:PREDICTED: glutathione S-transferase-like [Dinoponera quadriceps]
MPEKYKLTYFNATGIAEPIRYMFHYAGCTKFEDVHLNFNEWPKFKPEMPLRQLPVLEIDGKMYNQSRAIARYLAKKCNLYSDDAIEALEIDGTVDSLEDLRQALGTFYWEKEPIMKQNLKKIAFEKLPYFLDKFEEQVKRNDGHFVRGKLTWADIMYAAYTQMFTEFCGNDVNKNHPELQKLVDKVHAIPNIKAYLEKRSKEMMFIAYPARYIPQESPNFFIVLLLAGGSQGKRKNMSTYKLIYFNVTGLAESIRYMFHYGGIEFEDDRIDIADWPRQKAALANFRWKKDPVVKEKFNEIAFEKLPFCLRKFEEQVKENGGYFVRGKLSWVDFTYEAYTEYLNAFLTMDLNKDHPELKKLVDKVHALPNVKAYLEKRPKALY